MAKGLATWARCVVLVENITPQHGLRCARGRKHRSAVVAHRHAPWYNALDVGLSFFPLRSRCTYILHVIEASLKDNEREELTHLRTENKLLKKKVRELEKGAQTSAAYVVMLLFCSNGGHSSVWDARRQAIDEAEIQKIDMLLKKAEVFSGVTRVEPCCVCSAT